MVLIYVLINRTVKIIIVFISIDKDKPINFSSIEIEN